MDDLERELAAYRSKLSQMIAEQGEGKYALLHEEQLIDVYGTYEDAIKAGYEKFGLERFLVKQVESMEHVHYITDISPCPTSLLH